VEGAQHEISNCGSSLRRVRNTNFRPECAGGGYLQPKFRAEVFMISSLLLFLFVRRLAIRAANFVPMNRRFRQKCVGELSTIRRFK
jgi:hypothetical protein